MSFLAERGVLHSHGGTVLLHVHLNIPKGDKRKVTNLAGDTSGSVLVGR